MRSPLRTAAAGSLGKLPGVAIGWGLKWGREMGESALVAAGAQQATSDGLSVSDQFLTGSSSVWRGDRR